MNKKTSELYKCIDRLEDLGYKFDFYMPEMYFRHGIGGTKRKGFCHKAEVFKDRIKIFETEAFINRSDMVDSMESFLRACELEESFRKIEAKTNPRPRL